MTVLLVGSIGVAGGLIGRSGGSVVVLAAATCTRSSKAAIVSGTAWGSAVLAVVLSQCVLQGAYLATVTMRLSRRARIATAR